VEQNYVFEVLAREGHRVDKVLVLTTKIAGTNPKSANAVNSSDALNVHPPSARCRNPGPRPNLATPRQQRDRAAASIGSEHQKNLRAAQWWILQSFPASGGPSSNQRYAGGAGWGRSEHWNVHTPKPPRAPARKPHLSPRSLRAEAPSRGAPQRQPTSLMSRCQSLPSLTRTADPSCR